MRKKILALAIIIASTLIITPPARAAEIDAETLAKRVGQVFAGYDDFWVWVTQRQKMADGRIGETRGRAYFKREKMFRLNFGQPPKLVHGTDGEEYWIYDAEKKTIEYTKLDRNAPVHPLFGVFAAGDQMVKALDKYFNIDSFEETTYGEPAEKAYKLVISWKPEMLKQIRESGENKLTRVDKQSLTFIVDTKTYLPREIRVENEGGDAMIFELETFHNNIGLDPGIFKRPSAAGIKEVEIK